LLASEVALRRLDGNVAEQELDLVEFAAREVAQTRTGSSEIVRRQFVDAGASSRRADDVSQHFGRHAVSPYAPGLVNRSKDRPAGDGDRRGPRIYGRLHPRWDRNGPYMAALAD
jgi:hypothetical protein